METMKMSILKSQIKLKGQVTMTTHIPTLIRIMTTTVEMSHRWKTSFQTLQACLKPSWYREVKQQNFTAKQRIPLSWFEYGKEMMEMLFSLAVSKFQGK